ncbi:hypothetical protein BDP27DRAFT_1331344 [Rhodocollybia butyracea]|uniref:Uncharacterized protein n=1 Tax=Rhodocollybia butyracea TaxID=206335 RepID=A0A9P5U3Q8_9AGAR|nr:hypothetical protein BDP27DRAFT_1331344 [Rhodocollybia butyracea]
MSSFTAQLVSDCTNGGSLSPGLTDALSLQYKSIGLIAQTFVYGIYTCLMPISTFVMLKTGLQTSIQKFLLGMTIFMYMLSSVQWIVSIINLIQAVQLWFVPLNPDECPPNFVPVFSALSLVNYILSDGVVVWRARVLCDSDWSSRALKIPMGLLCCLSVSVTATIIIRIMLESPEAGRDARLFTALSKAIDVIQIANLVFSLLTNTFSTSIVGVKAWKYRQNIKKNFECLQGRKSKVDKVFVILVESGVFYTLFGIGILVPASLIRLPYGTLGDVLTPASFQIAGIYPLAVLLLVNRDSPLKRSVFASTIPISIPHDSQPREELTHPGIIVSFGTAGTVGTMEDDRESDMELDTESDHELSLKSDVHEQRPSPLWLSGWRLKTLPDTPEDMPSATV